MASEWENIKLSDLTTKIGSGATPLGGKEAYQNEGINLIRSQNVYNLRFEPYGIAYINDEQAKKLSNVILESQDLLLNITGDSIARCCQVPESYLPARVNQHVAIIRVDSRKLESRYLLYYLTSPEMQSYMLGVAGGGATRNALTKSMIEAFEIPLPPLPIQRQIAAILSAFDDKIELNRQMNRTLEQMARALFKSWFVDFEPVRAKMRGGQPEGMDAATAALFASELVEVDGREVPKGWEIKGLDEIADFLNGLALQKFPPTGENDLPVIKIAQLRKGNTEGSGFAARTVGEKYIVKDGDILFSWSGSLEVVRWSGGEGALNQHLFKVTSSEYPNWFIFWWLLEHLLEFQAIAANKATTMGHIQRKHLNDAKAVLPPKDLLLRLGEYIYPLFESMFQNDQESSRLASLRDALLPRLLSGEVDVSEWEGME